jgi:hypothetical protein
MTAIKRIESEWNALREVITKPPVLKKLKDWPKWFNLLKTYYYELNNN